MNAAQLAAVVAAATALLARRPAAAAPPPSPRARWDLAARLRTADAPAARLAARAGSRWKISGRLRD